MMPPIQATFAPADGQLEHGKYLFNSRGCMECHGADGAGHVVIDDKDSGFFVRAPNITAGGASPARGYTDTDWLRTVRHGVKPSGEPLLIMPSEDYARMTDADVGAIVAYVRSLPPANGGAAEFSPWPLPIKAAYLFGAIKDAAEQFKSMLRTGKRPDGTAVSGVMPFKSLAYMNDSEIDALFAFLKSLDARPFGRR